MNEFTKGYRVREENLPVLTQRLEKLNKRADKLGVEGISLVETGRELVKNHEDNTFFTVVLVTVSGARVKLDGGWGFLGVIEHTDIGNILRPAPGQTIPTEYRNVGRKCDWCNTDRKRTDTYVVESEAGEVKQVGRNCLLDFTGHADPHKYASWAEWLVEFDEFAESLEEDHFGGGGTPNHFGLWSYLEVVAMTIRLYGWTPRSKAGDYTPATADSAISFYYDMRKGKAFDKDGAQLYTRDGRPVQTEPEDMEIAKAAVAWLQGLPEAKIQKSDYLWNLYVAIANAVEGDKILPRRQLGIAASLISAHQRDENAKQEALARARANGHDPIHVGEIKKRQEFTGLEVTGVFTFENDFGVTYMHKFVDADGNQLVWYKSTYPALEVGVVYSGKATVKTHNEFNGVPQTVITRANLVEDEDTDEN